MFVNDQGCPYNGAALLVIGIVLSYCTFDKLQSANRADVVQNKRLDSALAAIQAERAKK